MNQLFHEWLYDREYKLFFNLKRLFPEARYWSDDFYLEIDFKGLGINLDWACKPYVVFWWRGSKFENLQHKKFDDIEVFRNFVIDLMDFEDFFEDE